MRRTLLFAGLLFLISCSQKEQFPSFKTEKAELTEVKLLGKLHPENVDSAVHFVALEKNEAEIERLLHLQEQYFQKDAAFDFNRFCLEWADFVTEKSHIQLTVQEKINWFTLTGTLLQLTGDAKYAEEMQKILQSGFPPSETDENIDDLVAPYIFTKNVDHIHVNLFVPAEISYEHSLHGKVKITQEFPGNNPNTVFIKFSMEKERYIELFVLIPEWAEGATVTVKNVKYFAPPGQYCQIAKEWLEGDVVEVYLPKTIATVGL